MTTDLLATIHARNLALIDRFSEALRRHDQRAADRALRQIRANDLRADAIVFAYHPTPDPLGLDTSTEEPS